CAAYRGPGASVWWRLWGNAGGTGPGPDRPGCPVQSAIATRLRALTDGVGPFHVPIAMNTRAPADCLDPLDSSNANSVGAPATVDADVERLHRLELLEGLAAGAAVEDRAARGGAEEVLDLGVGGA